MFKDGMGGWYLVGTGVGNRAAGGSLVGPPPGVAFCLRGRWGLGAQFPAPLQGRGCAPARGGPGGSGCRSGAGGAGWRGGVGSSREEALWWVPRPIRLCMSEVPPSTI
ncbi:hypothetical protein GCM10010372_01130 [Streptomyces tauricus]|nr:hypothetical protein GCM10010372_01130 [Streptomyces tauricus]